MNHGVVVASQGPWQIERFSVEKSTPGLAHDFLRGRGIPPGEYTRLMHKVRGCVMSDTPAEVRDMSSFIYHAKGAVLINGLGLGIALAAILNKRAPEKSVSSVTVIEIDQDIIDLVGSKFAADPRVSIINESAFDFQPPRGVRYQAVWHDIWDDICRDNLDEMKALHKKYARRTDWQASWGRDQLSSLR